MGVLAYHRGDKAERKGFFGTRESLLGDFGEWGNWVWTLLIGCHCSHLVEYIVALLCYYLLYSDGAWLEEAKVPRLGWMGRIVLFNLVCELSTFGFWHWFTYMSAQGKALQPVKFNPENQYEPSGKPVGFFRSETGHLEREITFNTLGWLQSAGWQILLTFLWARGSLPVYTDFWSRPVYSVALLLAPTYWREIHFYFAHRLIHPWWDRSLGLMDGDIGAFLYRHVHSLHHKSYNPGPWSGLSMHPVEHFIYYSCAWLPPLFMAVHPLHFLYTKFHADIAPVGGHDGKGPPSPGSDYHYLHHAKFECNYGTPFPINFDGLFGTWVDLAEFQKAAAGKGDAATLKGMHDPEEEEGEAPIELRKRGKDKEFTMEEVAKHSSKSDCWIVLYGRVIDASRFLSKHPGGEKAILSLAGKDATKAFDPVHSTTGGFSLVAKWAPNADIGYIKGWTGPSPPKSDGVSSKSVGLDPLLILGPSLFLAALSALMA